LWKAKGVVGRSQTTFLLIAHLEQERREMEKVIREPKAPSDGNTLGSSAVDSPVSSSTTDTILDSSGSIGHLGSDALGYRYKFG
jgi:hypothetical protein